jgi:hypothetical protein
VVLVLLSALLVLLSLVGLQWKCSEVVVLSRLSCLNLFQV